MSTERIQMGERSRTLNFTNDKYWITNSSKDLICLLSNQAKNIRSEIRKMSYNYQVILFI